MPWSDSQWEWGNLIYSNHLGGNETSTRITVVHFYYILSIYQYHPPVGAKNLTIHASNGSSNARPLNLLGCSLECFCGALFKIYNYVRNDVSPSFNLPTWIGEYLIEVPWKTGIANADLSVTSTRIGLFFWLFLLPSAHTLCVSHSLMHVTQLLSCYCSNWRSEKAEERGEDWSTTGGGEGRKEQAGDS